MENVMGLLKVRVMKGRELVIRDLNTSDPYVLVNLGNQTVRTRVVKNNLNPIWDEELTLAVPDPAPPLQLQVLDKDTLSKDDKMGDAQVDLKPLVTAIRTKDDGHNANSDIELCRVVASKDNCLVRDSCIRHVTGKTVQEVCLRLQNVESGELELELKWIDLSQELKR